MGLEKRMKFKKLDPLQFNQVSYSGEGTFVISKSEKTKIHLHYN
jgi:hypothetical protein